MRELRPGAPCRCVSASNDLLNLIREKLSLFSAAPRIEQEIPSQASNPRSGGQLSRGAILREVFQPGCRSCSMLLDVHTHDSLASPSRLELLSVKMSISRCHHEPRNSRGSAIVHPGTLSPGRVVQSAL